MCATDARRFARYERGSATLASLVAATLGFVCSSVVNVLTTVSVPTGEPPES